MNADIGKYMIIAGLLIVIAGAIVFFFHDKLHWIGRLPGDIRIEKENFRFYFPIATMLLAGIVLSLLWQIIKKLLH